MANHQDPTKVRLIEAAGREFAEKGFDLARVRTICEGAGANLASVNYHFGDKEQLYREVLMEAHRCGSGAGASPPVDSLPPGEKLRAFIHHFLDQVVALGKDDTWHNRLMMREILDPTPALEFVVREAIRPRFELLKSIMREIRPDADDQRLNALCFSVIGQALHYKVARKVMPRLIGSEAFEALDATYLADHIARFSLAALGVEAEAGQGASPSRGAAKTATKS